MNVDAYSRMLKTLLPRGRLWLLQVGSWVSKTALGAAEELARVDARGVDFLDEADPRTASETLADWERVLGLPDERVPEISTDPAERRVAITQKYTSLGGQNLVFWSTLTASCGYELVEVNNFGGAVLRVGFRVNDRVYGDAYAYSMELVVNPPEGAALSHADFERVIRHATHSHILSFVTYL